MGDWQIFIFTFPCQLQLQLANFIRKPDEMREKKSNDLENPILLIIIEYRHVWPRMVSTDLDNNPCRTNYRHYPICLFSYHHLC